MSDFTSTVTDPRVLDIAEYTGMDTTDVLAVAEEAAEVQGLSLDQELDLVEENIDEEVFDTDNSVESDEDEDEDEDDEILAGWSEDDEDAEYIPC